MFYSQNGEIVVSITQKICKKFGGFILMLYIRSVKNKHLSRMNNLFGRFYYYYYYFANSSKVGQARA